MFRPQDLFSEGVALCRRVDPGRPLRLLSLFSGCGGLDLGFEGGFCVPSGSYPSGAACADRPGWVMVPKTGFRALFANDIIPEAKVLWERYFGDRAGVYHLGSLVDLVARHRAGDAVFPTGVDLVTGGFPCQDFSVAGLRRGFASGRDHNGKLRDEAEPSVATRGQLYMWMRSVVEIVRPRVFVAENVKGLVSLGDVKDVIQRDFASAGGDGYLVLPPRVLHAGHYGVAQSRERVFFIGLDRASLRPEVRRVLEGEVIPLSLDPYPWPTHRLRDEEDYRYPFVSVGEVLDGLPEPADSEDLSQQSYSRAKWMGAHCQGQVEVNLTGLAPTIRSEHHGNIEFRRLSLSHGGRHEGELSGGLGERRLTVRECARIQSFPDEYEFVLSGGSRGRRYAVSPSAAYRLVGNAVPPLLGYHLARRLAELWEVYFGEGK